VKSAQLYKHIILLIFGALILTSCDYFFPQNNKVESPNIDTLIDYNTVDAFPLFPECKDIPSRDKQKICFQIKMAEHINTLLKEGVIKTTSQNNDTLMVLLKVLQTGKTQIVSVKSKSNNKAYIQFLDSILRGNIVNMPTLQPAIKRGIPVTTQFELPIIIKSTTF
jgi:hypothetical protein